MRVGMVLGTKLATPLEFWVGIEEGHTVQLDDVVFVQSGGIGYYGVITEVQRYLEGSELVYEEQLATRGIIPVNVAYIAKVNTIRIEPEVFTPPFPGSDVYLAQGMEFERALYFDQMKNKIPAGLTRSGMPIFLNYDFINGREGAHVSISGMSGIATKTSYALFLLYSILSKAPDKDRIHALVFNVKGKDLLWIDKKNKRVEEEDKRSFESLGLKPEPFKDVVFYVPPREDDTEFPDCERTDDRVVAFSWTMREFAEEGLIRFMFAEGDESMTNLGYLIEHVANKLYHLAKQSPPGRLLDDNSRDIESLVDLLERLEEASADPRSEEYSKWFGKAQPQTVQAFMRRFERAVRYVKRFIAPPDRIANPIRWEDSKVSVVDISSLHSIAKMFVVGAVLKKVFRDKEDSGQAYPKIFVVLDELNKYAPKEGWSPIKDTLLDIAERGRSLGIILIGAQQTASEIEKRIVANSAIKVLGRVDSSEIFSKEYDFLTGNFKQRAIMLKKGTMILYQPDIPNPLVIRFPKPPWATRKEEAEEESHVAEDFGYF